MPLFSYECDGCGRIFELLLPKRDKTARCLICRQVAKSLYGPFSISYGVSRVRGGGEYVSGLGKFVKDTFEKKREMANAGLMEVDANEVEAIQKEEKEKRMVKIEAATAKAKHLAKERLREERWDADRLRKELVEAKRKGRL